MQLIFGFRTLKIMDVSFWQKLTSATMQKAYERKDKQKSKTLLRILNIQTRKEININITSIFYGYFVLDLDI